MRRMFVLVAACILVLSACGSSAGDSAPASEATTVPLVASSSTVTTTTVAPTTSAITTTVPSTTTSIPSEEAGPDYLVTGPEGVFRVVDGDATRVLDRADIWWAADDGMGGVVYAPNDWPPSTIGWMKAGSTISEVFVENVIGMLGFVTLLEGHPHVVTVREFPPETSGSLPSVATVVYDLVSGTEKVVGSYPSSGETWMHPQSMGGRWGVEAYWAAKPPGSRLGFTDLAGTEIDVAGNPWPEFCLGCGLWPYLSPDGTFLAIVEFLPAPTDLAVADWDSFLELDKAEQWDRWFAATANTPVTLRIVDLETGDTLHSHLLPSILGSEGWNTIPGALESISDFDGRYAVLCSYSCDFPSDHILVDGHTGEQLPINWGVSEPGSEHRTIRLFLPVPAANEISLRADGLGLASFGDPMDEVAGLLVRMLGEPDEVTEGSALLGEGTIWWRWVEERLNVFFSAAHYYRDDGVVHFFQWSTGGVDFTTPDGLGVGSTVADLRAVYGDQLTVTDFSECGMSRNELSLPNGMGFNVAGEDDPEDLDANVESLYAGAFPSCH